MSVTARVKVKLMALFLFVGLAGLIPRYEVVEAKPMSFWWWRDYYSDDTFSTWVGYRAQLCTSMQSAGSTSSWIMYDGGDCETGDPTGSGCCNDTNGNGQCDWMEPLVSCSPGTAQSAARSVKPVTAPGRAAIP